MENLINKYTEIDIIMEIFSKDISGFFILEKIEEIPLKFKKYKILVYSNNEQENEDYIAALNNAIQTDLANILEFDKNNPLPKEFDDVGSIECKFSLEYLVIKLEYEGKVIKEFKFRIDDNLGEFINYIKTEFRKIIHKRVVND